MFNFLTINKCSFTSFKIISKINNNSIKYNITCGIIEYYSNYFGKQKLDESQIQKIETLKNQSLTLGLDLQGGIHMVLELDLVDLYINLMNDEYQNDFKELKNFEDALINVSNNSTSINFIDN